ncbi:hypothetical protein B5M09_011029 [Aphanomyces astaci]|uniref:Uncharacterized protein n=1 Tax=Aphanomyces astaci TaxID=112090 RepID=A0A425CQY1_APHAT|nr:hypothetical protein B5M09_011029 [Aphanomyces astaci]
MELGTVRQGVSILENIWNNLEKKIYHRKQQAKRLRQDDDFDSHSSAKHNATTATITTTILTTTLVDPVITTLATAAVGTRTASNMVMAAVGAPKARVAMLALGNRKATVDIQDSRKTASTTNPRAVPALVQRPALSVRRPTLPTMRQVQCMRVPAPLQRTLVRIHDASFHCIGLLLH